MNLNYDKATKVLWDDSGWRLCKRRTRVETLAKAVVDAAVEGLEVRNQIIAGTNEYQTVLVLPNV